MPYRLQKCVGLGRALAMEPQVLLLDCGKKTGDSTPGEVRGNQDVIRACLGAAH